MVALLIHLPNHFALGRSEIFASSSRFSPVDRSYGGQDWSALPL